jgi:hypothetical protein
MLLAPALGADYFRFGWTYHKSHVALPMIADCGQLTARPEAIMLSPSQGLALELLGKHYPQNNSAAFSQSLYTPFSVAPNVPRSGLGQRYGYSTQANHRDIPHAAG